MCVKSTVISAQPNGFYRQNTATKNVKLARAKKTPF